MDLKVKCRVVNKQKNNNHLDNKLPKYCNLKVSRKFNIYMMYFN